MVRNEPNWSDVFYGGSLVNLIRNMDFGITDICNYLKNKTIYGLENERSFLLSFLPSILMFILLFDERKNIYRDRERYICSWDVAIPIFWISNIFFGQFASIHVSFLIFFRSFVSIFLVYLHEHFFIEPYSCLFSVNSLTQQKSTCS